MSGFVVVSEKKYHVALFQNLKLIFPDFNWYLIDNKADFNISYLNEIKPKLIFIPHWSYIISKKIFNEYECIVFHMTDLPFGRGGSPLQNLISRGYKTTKISAIKVESGIDTGDVYLKKMLNLDGSATDIFNKSTLII